MALFVEVVTRIHRTTQFTDATLDGAYQVLLEFSHLANKVHIPISVSSTFGVPKYSA
jgi:hypothetical protein